MKKLEGHYNHQQVEKDRYKIWLKNGYFNVNPQRSESYAMMIPPPNITGNLHIGHALDTGIQDAIIRYQRLLGKDTLYLPGMDHAGIATQARVMRSLAEAGVDTKTLSRDDFLKATWEWKNRFAKDIHEQWSLLGLSLDYQFETFTLDEKMQTAVKKVFVDYYQKGLIYQGYRIINWDPVQQTALSNIEVIHQEVTGHLYYFKYLVVGQEGEYLEVATTRPETMFADQALVVNPKDERYHKYHGQSVINPVNREVLSIILDEYVDMSFGTGAMKCTPAHDLNDYKLGLKHHLEMPLCMRQDGTMNELALEFQNLDRFVCRERLIAKMKEHGILIKIESIKHNVGFSERSNAIIEPYLSQQWFVRMRPLADQVIALQKSPQKINFHPKRFEKVFLNWMENIEDWCISRQLWWGHRIPAYYHKETNEVLVSVTPPVDLDNYRQDDDVLDTWFSSALWPFATLGWPENSLGFQRYYPNSSLVTAYDIIFFWVSRMIFQGYELTGVRPFEHVIIHGLIRDSAGHKMSKSRGNGIDPRLMIEKYGTDSLRHYLLGAASMGQDINFNEEKIKDSNRYFDKLYNVTRYVNMQFGETFVPLSKEEIIRQKKSLSYFDKAVLIAEQKLLKKYKTLMNNYRLNLATTALYSFVYDEFCANYVELSKVILNDPDVNPQRQDLTRSVLYHVLKDILLLLNPFAPFISETLYQSLPQTLDSINMESYPETRFPSDRQAMLLYRYNLEIINSVRNLKNQLQIPPKQTIKLHLSPRLAGLRDPLFIQSLVRFLKAEIIFDIPDSTKDAGTYLIAHPQGDIYVSIEALDNAQLGEEKRQRIRQQLTLTEAEISRSEAILHNENFLRKAPLEKINSEKEKYASYLKTRESLLSELKSLD